MHKRSNEESSELKQFKEFLCLTLNLLKKKLIPFIDYSEINPTKFPMSNTFASVLKIR